MLSFRTCQVLLLGTILLATPAFAAGTSNTATAKHHRSHHHLRHTHVIKGQRQIEPDRAREIQEALIREHYLTAPASGQWDSNTEAAMQKYQSDHGWQTKLTPDSRALIKLGLGPKNDATPAIATPVATTANDAAAAPADTSARPASNTLADAHTLQN